MGRYLHAIKVEGLGDVSASTATDKRYRICYGRGLMDDVASYDPDGLLLDGLLMWPSELSADVDFRDGRSTLSSQSFALRATDTTRGLFYRLRHSVSARLIAAMTASQTTIDVDTASLDGAYTLERERIVIDGSTQSTITGGYRYDVTRAALSTLGLAHGVDTTDDIEIFQTLHTLGGRVVQLVRIPLGETVAYASEEVLWTGVLRDVATGDTGLTLDLSVDSLLGLVEDQRILVDRFQGELTSAWLDVATRGQTRLRFEVISDKQPAAGSGVSSDPPNALLMVSEDFVLRARCYVVDRGATRFISASADLQTFAGPPVPDDLGPYASVPTREVFSTRGDAPSNVDSGSVGDNTLPLSKHPGKLVLQLLTTTVNGDTAGPNGSYDTGINALAGRIPASLVDTAGILQWGDEVGVRFDALYLGAEEGGRGLGEVLKELLTPLMSALVATRDGKLTVVRLKDSAEYDTTATLTQSQIRSARITHTRQLTDAVDRISLEYNAEPGFDADRINATDTIKYKRQPPGESSSLALRLAGVRRRDIATQVVQSIIQRYHDPIPVFFVEVLPTVELELGDIVRVTHDKLPAGDGTRGRTSAPMLVISRREAFSGDAGSMGDHVFVYGLMDVGLIHPRDGWIAPSGVVQASPAPTTTVFSIGDNDFTENGSGPLSKDINGFAAGDYIDIMDEFGTPQDTGLKISTIINNQITVTPAASAAPSAGDIIRPSAYAQVVSSQKDDWVFVANASELLGSDEPKTYRS